MNPTGRVVVLEEDQQIRTLLGRWLSEIGYEAATHPPAAGASPVLVIADVRDPRTAEVIIRPLREYGVAILVTSARFRHGLAGSAAAARRLGVNAVLPKPFTRAEFLAAVRESMEGSD